MLLITTNAIPITTKAIPTTTKVRPTTTKVRPTITMVIPITTKTTTIKDQEKEAAPEKIIKELTTKDKDLEALFNGQTHPTLETRKIEIDRTVAIERYPRKNSGAIVVKQ